MEANIRNDYSKIQRITPSAWGKIKPRLVDIISPLVDGLCAFKIESISGTKDDRNWAKDFATKWAGNSNVRYRNCKGSYICDNPLCHYYIQFKQQNGVNFDKQGACATCSAQGTFKPCKARRYVGKKGSMYMVYHIGNHDCNSNPKPSRPRDIVSQALSQDPMVKPCKIQSNFIISAIWNRGSWRNVLEKVSNEKVKQNKHIYNFGASFDAVIETKSYLNEKDKLLVYNIDESAGTVFKTATAKMKMAQNLDMDKEHFLNKEYIFFDGKVKRTKNFTASIYHSLLRK